MAKLLVRQKKRGGGTLRFHVSVLERVARYCG